MASPAPVIPQQGKSIEHRDGKLHVPDRPIIPFIEGDGIGKDIWVASQRVFDAAVAKAYGARRKLEFMEVYAGEKSKTLFDNWLPDETVAAFRKYLVGIKGPLTTPVGGGIRSLNVALRQMLDLYVCLRPVRWFKGVPSPVKRPDKVEMTIFRENTEDIYAGIEYAAGSPEAQKILDFIAKESPKDFKKIRFGTEEASAGWQAQLEAIGGPKRKAPVLVAVGIKPVSYLGTERLVHSAISFAIEHKRKSVTLVHKGNIMKFTEGGFRDWGYALAQKEFGAELIDGGPWMKFKNPKSGHEIVIKDVIADAFLQQILLRPAEYSVIATLNLNGDYVSDALAAQVGGIGIAPGANLSDSIAMFEATHGTAPKYAGKDYVNPGSEILSAEMMLRHMGWLEAADLIISSMEKAILSKKVTYDFARLMEGATQVSCSGFGQVMIDQM